MYCIIKLSTSTTVQSRDLLIRVGILRCIEILNHFFAKRLDVVSKTTNNTNYIFSSHKTTKVISKQNRNRFESCRKSIEYDFSMLSRGNSEKNTSAPSLTDYLPTISSDAQPSIYREIRGTWARERISLNPRAFARMSALSRLAKVFSIRV